MVNIMIKILKFVNSALMDVQNAKAIQYALVN